MIVRKSDEKRLVFAFLSLLPKQFCVKSVSSPDEAPRSSSKKPAARRIFNSPLSVSSGHKTQRLMIYILLIKQRESSPNIC